MGEQFTVDPPDRDLIRRESGRATETAIMTNWLVLNDELKRRRRTVLEVKNKLEGKVFSSAPTVAQNDFDTQGAMTVLFTGSTNFNLSGLANPSEGRIITLFNVGSATITVLHASVLSAALNRFRTFSGASVSLTTDKAVTFYYLNSLWRELKAA